MKKIILDLKDMSDSKEVYGQRPNPFFSIFIYSLVALLAVALIYAFVGKIDIVATASGIVRPNDDISTISSLTSGKITNVYFWDGQSVQEGDNLFSIDTTETQISLDSLLQTQETYQFQLDMLQKFLEGIENGKNPFSSDTESEEYPYYIQYQDFALSIKNTALNGAYDEEKVLTDISTLKNQISTIEAQMIGLNCYKKSVQQNQDLTAAYPEYESQYQAYISTLDGLKNDYDSQKAKIELDSSSDSNDYYANYYQTQINGYQQLIDSINSGKNIFSTGDASTFEKLYQDYSNNYEDYQRSYDSAREEYNFYKNGGSTGGSATDYLAYDNTMLEGYNYYRQSVISGKDSFLDTRDSVFYRALYVEYQTKYDALNATVTSATATYDALAADASAAPEDVATALSAKKSAESARDEFKSSTLLTIDNTILQIKETIAGKEVSLGESTSSYNMNTAKIKMDSAQSAISAYKNKTLAEYSSTLEDLKNKLNDLNLAAQSTQSKSDLLDALEASYQQSKNQQYYSTINQIDSSLQSLKSELSSAQSNLKLNQLADQLYQKNRDEHGKPMAVSTASVEQVSSLLSNQDTLESKLDELNTQIQQARTQIEQGTIVAEQSGVINASSNLVKGDVISAGTTVATIIPSKESEYKVQLYISNADLSDVKVGDFIKYSIVALPSSQYGMVNGMVTKISKDALVQQNSEISGYFLVEGTLESTSLTDKSGNTADISIGMEVSAKIVTQRKSIIRYLLEKINLW